MEPIAQALSDTISKGNYKKALTFCEKKLEIDPDNSAVKTTKCLCFIQVGQYDDALSYMNTLSSDLQKNLITERVYCMYKLRKHDEALDALSQISSLTIAQQHLKAQTHYRMGNYSECMDVLKDIKGKEDTPELLVNMAAASCLGNSFEECVKEAQKENQHSYELSFNVSCILLQSNDFVAAEQQLLVAEKIGRDILPQQEYSEQEIEDELAGVQAQLAYIYQMTNRDTQAIEIYEKILKEKPSDSSVVAVASNNVVTLHKDHKLFNAEKNLFNAISAADDHKLTDQQQKVINFNRAVVYLKMGKMEKCNEIIESLRSNYPESPLPSLIQAAALLKEKQTEEAENLLKESAAKGNLTTKLTLAQLLLKDGKTQECIDALQSLGEDSYKLGIVATCVRLYQQLKEPEKAHKLLNDAINHWTKNGDEATLAKMKVASSYVEEISSASSSLADEDIEKLENVAVRSNNRDDADAPQGEDQIVERKKKNKRKKKKRLPKNYDPNSTPDPERWLPRSQRSSFKKRRKKMRGGHQGGSDSSPVPAKSNQPAVHASSKNAKKKGGRR